MLATLRVYRPEARIEAGLPGPSRLRNAPAVHCAELHHDDPYRCISCGISCGTDS